MKTQNGLGIVFAFAALSSVFSFPVQAHSRLYLQTYLKAEEASRLQSEDKTLDARVMFDECLFYMECLHRLSPDWEGPLVGSKIIEYRKKIVELEVQAAREAMTPETRDAATSLFEEGCRESAKEGPMSALREFEKSFMIMTLVREHDPNWHSELMSKDFESCRARLASIRSQILADGAGDSML